MVQGKLQKIVQVLNIALKVAHSKAATHVVIEGEGTWSTQVLHWTDNPQVFAGVLWWTSNL